MSNYLYHPLGNYASSYVDGSATTAALPHTSSTNGFGEVDFLVGGDQSVYSMTDGTITSCGSLKEGEISRCGCVVKTSDTGYSRMQAKRQGGTADDYPLYFNYLDLKSLESSIKVGDTIKKGQKIGVTGAGTETSFHFVIQPYDVYNTNEIPIKAQQFKGAISLGQNDAYGNKGDNYNLADFLDENFQYDKNGIKDHTGKYIGVKGSNGLYYPPDSSGTAVTTCAIDKNEGNFDPSLEIGRWYSHLLMMQTPIKVESSCSMAAGWYPKDDWSDGIEGYFSNGRYTFPIYLQGRGPWSGEKFGNGTFANSGCSGTSAAIVASGVLGKTITPSDIAKTIYSISGSSSPRVLSDYSNLMGIPISHLGGKIVEPSPISKEKMLSYLAEGIPVIVNAGDYSHWGPGGAYGTQNGHVFTLLSYNTETGEIFIGDPNPGHASGWFKWSDVYKVPAIYSPYAEPISD